MPGSLLALAFAVGVPEGVAQPAYECANLAKLAASDGGRLPAFQSEIWRIVDWFDACTRRPRESEATLYTWGHRRKLERMLRDERLLFHAYDTARQITYNQLQAERILDLLPGRRADVVRMARQYAADSRLYDLLQLNDLQRVDAPDRDALRLALTVAMYEQWLPGFLDLADTPVAERRNRFLARARETTNPLRRHQAEGAADGLVQFEERQAGPGTRDFQSSSSHGWGVSFSINPMEHITHFYDDQHMGLACDLPADNPRIMIDLGNAAAIRALQDAQVLIPEATQLSIKNLTLFVRPRAAEDASRGRILVTVAGVTRSTVYTDKGALAFPAACRPITLDSFPCGNWQALRAAPRYAGLRNESGGGPVRRYFRRAATAGLSVAADVEPAYAALERQKDATCGMGR